MQRGMPSIGAIIADIQAHVDLGCVALLLLAAFYCCVYNVMFIGERRRIRKSKRGGDLGWGGYSLFLSKLEQREPAAVMYVFSVLLFFVTPLICHLFK